MERNQGGDYREPLFPAIACNGIIFVVIVAHIVGSYIKLLRFYTTGKNDYTGHYQHYAFLHLL
jgi:hypothetical protein